MREVDGDWLCDCGNSPDSDGFYSCRTDGTQVEPVDGEWDGQTMVCARCELVFAIKDVRC